MHPPLHQPPANRLWFVLGREPLLSAAEIFSILPTKKDAFLFSPPILRLQAHADPARIILRLGGTIKIGTEIARNIRGEAIVQTLASELQKISGKIIFGISYYETHTHTALISPEHIKNMGRDIKNLLKSLGRSARYIPNKEAALSSATVFHNDLHISGREFLLVRDGDAYSIALTQAVQPFEDFGARDFGRPGRDDVSGMLPPKLAMMMINVAVGPTKKLSDFVLLDPFCGSGTIVTEAMRFGITHLLGTDISEKAVRDTRANVDWTLQSLKKTQDDFILTIEQADATSLSSKISLKTVDCIVTEPYLGPPLKGRETKEQVKHNCAELAVLYSRAFAELSKVIKPGGTVVAVIPRFKAHDLWFTVSDRIMAGLKKLGFEKERLLPEEISPSFYLLYHRASQRVGREIWKFAFKPPT